MAKQDMLINHVHDEECRIAIVEDGRLEELYTERSSADLHVSNIYRGRVTNVESSIQAAFVDFGEARSGFLHITDLHPRYFPGEDGETTERVGHKTPRRDRPPIQHCLKRGQEILVQVLKEGIGTKGPTLTSYLSIPGRYLVMMPNMERHGVSRKIEDLEKRRAMRQLLDELNPPEELGFIVRTAGFERPKSELKRDLNYLVRLWKSIKKQMHQGRGPRELHTESDLVIRTLRDVLTTDVRRIIVDSRVAALRARQFLRVYMPRSSTKVYHHADPIPLFDAFDIERQIQTINQREVPLENGGSLVFDQTEALVAVDVNSGKFRDKSDAEQTAFKTNQQAVDEIARQLRMRDLGGLLVLDLIDMYASRHRREIEKRFQDHLKRDRARTKVLRISELGMLEMTRQRMRPSLKKSVYDECATCGGIGHVLSPESVVLSAMRRLAVVLSSDRVARVELTAHPEVLAMLLNRKRGALVQLERGSGKLIEFRFDPAFGPDHVEFKCANEKGAAVDAEKLPHPSKPKFTQEHEISVRDLKELDELEAERLQDESGEPAGPEDDEAESGEPKKKRRRRRRSKKSSDAEAPGQAPEREREAERAKAEKKESEAAGAESADRNQAEEPKAASPESGAEGGEAAEGEGEGEKPKRKRRRRRGGRRRRKSKASGNGEAAAERPEDRPEMKADEKDQPETKADAAAEEKEKAEPEPAESDAPRASDSDEPGGDGETEEKSAKKKRSRGGRSRRGRGRKSGDNTGGKEREPAETPDTEPVRSGGYSSG